MQPCRQTLAATLGGIRLLVSVSETQGIGAVVDAVARQNFVANHDTAQQTDAVQQEVIGAMSVIRVGR